MWESFQKTCRYFVAQGLDLHDKCTDVRIKNIILDYTIFVYPCTEYLSDIFNLIITTFGTLFLAKSETCIGKGKEIVSAASGVSQTAVRI